MGVEQPFCQKWTKFFYLEENNEDKNNNEFSNKTRPLENILTTVMLTGIVSFCSDISVLLMVTFFRLILFYACECYAFMYVCAPLMCLDILGGQARVKVLDPLELEDRWLWATVWVLILELLSSARANSALNHWAIFSAP